MFTKVGSSPNENEWVFLYWGTANCLKYHLQRASVLWKKKEVYEIHKDDVKGRKLESLEDLSDGLPPNRDKNIYILIYDSTEISSGVSLHMVLAGHA